MKKVITLVLTLVILLSAVACNNKYEGPLSCISYIGKEGQTTMIDITEDSQSDILSILSGGEWIDGVTNCGHDYEFTAKNVSFRYHSECGTFIDITNGRYMTLSDDDKARVNEIFSVSDIINETASDKTTASTTAAVTTNSVTTKAATTIKTNLTPTPYPFDSGFDGKSLFVTVDGEKLVYNDRQSGNSGLTKKEQIGYFFINYSFESVHWNIYSTEEYPDLSVVIVESGTNIVWTYKMTTE